MRALQPFPLYQSDAPFGGLLRLLNDWDWDTPNQAATPYNLEQNGEQEYALTLAVPGFAEKDLSVETIDGILRVRGERRAGTDTADADADTDVANNTDRYVHRGIAINNFERRFDLADHVEVGKATLENGLLHIQLRRNTPPAEKPRRIKIAAH